VIVDEVLGEENSGQLGTMTEVPRTCTVANEIAEEADFPLL
jgi:phosphoenolpyruvate-protein kinase (PTS system EI component)